MSLGYFGKVAKPTNLTVEATFNWYYFLELMEPLGLELHHGTAKMAVLRNNAGRRKPHLGTTIFPRLLPRVTAWTSVRAGARSELQPCDGAYPEPASDQTGACSPNPPLPPPPLPRHPHREGRLWSTR